MHRLAQLDHRYLWHPFTQMRDWVKREPIVIVEGMGASISTPTPPSGPICMGIIILG